MSLCVNNKNGQHFQDYPYDDARTVSWYTKPFTPSASIHCIIHDIGFDVSETRKVVASSEDGVVLILQSLGK